MTNGKINYLQKKKVIINVFHTFSCLIIIIAIFLPWSQVRIVSLQSLYFLCSEHISTNLMSYSYMIGDYLQRFEITTGYTHSFAGDDGIVRCDPDHIFYFKKFCDNINEGAVLRPYRYYLGHNQTGACQLEYYSYEENTNHPKNDVFKLFYMFPFNLTHDMVRVYNETIDFRNWNYFTDGEFVDFVEYNRSNINFQLEIMHKEPYWNTGLAHFGGQNETRVFTINYPILGKYDPDNNRTNILKNFTRNKKITEKKHIQNITKFSNVYKYEKKNSNSSFNNSFIKNLDLLTKIKDYIRYYETKIMKKIYCFDDDNNIFPFAKNLEEAKNKFKKNPKEINEFNDTFDDLIIVSDVASSFFTESLYVILKEKKNDKFCHYIITDYLYNVLIDNEMGAIYPKSFNEFNQSIFPNISEINSSMWNSVEKEIINVPIDVPLLVNLTSIQYMIIKRIINARSRYSFYLIMLFEMNPKITEIYSLITNVFIICLACLCVIYFFLKFSINFTDIKYKQKLKRKLKTMSDLDKSLDNNSNTNLYMGKITESIEKLRAIQLMNSDDIHLNNAIDFAIKELTLNNEDFFNIELDFNENQTYSSFYSYLFDNLHNLSVLKSKNDEIIKKKEKSKRILKFYLKNENINNDKNKKDKNNSDLDIKRKDDQLFYTWKNKINLILNSNSDENLLNKNPHKYLVTKFMKFIHKRNLLFADIYPDSLLLFILTFTKENITAYHCKIKSFQLLKKLIKHNFKFWIKSKLDLFILFLASILRNSRITKSNEILYFFNSFIKINNDYFLNLLMILIDETNSNYKMEVYGSLLNRTQSADFSVSDSIKDMALFMKALLSFIDFAPYLSEYKENEMCFYEINEIMFSKKERENQIFVSNFHYEMSKNIVFPWLNLMNSISPENIKNALSKNLNFWYDKNQRND